MLNRPSPSIEFLMFSTRALCSSWKTWCTAVSPMFSFAAAVASDDVRIERLAGIEVDQQILAGELHVAASIAQEGVGRILDGRREWANRTIESVPCRRKRPVVGPRREQQLARGIDAQHRRVVNVVIREDQADASCIGLDVGPGGEADGVEHRRPVSGVSSTAVLPQTTRPVGRPLASYSRINALTL